MVTVSGVLVATGWGWLVMVAEGCGVPVLCPFRSGDRLKEEKGPPRFRFGPPHYLFVTVDGLQRVAVAVARLTAADTRIRRIRWDAKPTLGVHGEWARRSIRRPV